MSAARRIEHWRAVVRSLALHRSVAEAYLDRANGAWPRGGFVVACLICAEGVGATASGTASDGRGDSAPVRSLCTQKTHRLAKIVLLFTAGPL